jgi:hypothetical protein
MEFKVDGLFESFEISQQIYDIIKNKKIIEIGGPSLKNYWIPKFYELSEYTDIINFSDDNNISLNLGCGFNNNLPKKCNFIRTNNIEEYISENVNKYDILLTSHVLEHQANPIKQLLLWKKMLVKDGIMIHILPEKTISIDHNRPITSIDKLINNYNNNILENDVSEINDIIKYKNNDPTKIPGITDVESLINFLHNPDLILKYRPIHHHVYDFNLLSFLAEFINFNQSLYFNIYLDNWVFWFPEKYNDNNTVNNVLET